MKRWITILVYALVVGVLGWFIGEKIDAFSDLYTRLNWQWAAVCFILQIPVIFFLVWPSTYLINTFGYGIKLRDIFLLSHVCNLFNNLLPYRPGIGIRWLFLKHHYNVPTKTFLLNSVCFYSLVLLIALSIFLTMGAILDIPDSYFSDAKSPYVTAILFFLGILFIFLIHKKIKSFELLTTFFSTIIKRKSCLPVFFGSIFFNIVLMGVCLYCCFLALNNPLDFSICIWLISGIVLSSTVHVTPGNIGIAEFVVGTLTEFLIGDFNLGFAAFLLFRFTQLSAAILIGLPSIHYIINGHRGAIFQKPSIEE